VDKSRPPHSYSCKAQIARILQAVELNKVQYTFLWESDTVALAPLSRTPWSDMMQMSSEHNRFRTEVKATVDALFPYLKGELLGWTTTGGTLFDGRKLASKINAQTLDRFFNSSLWIEFKSKWSLADATEDCCLLATALLTGMSVGSWEEYGELPRWPNQRGVQERKACASCISQCHTEHPSAGLLPWKISLEPPDIDKCIHRSCGSKCPAVMHNVKQPWAKCILTPNFLCRGERTKVPGRDGTMEDICTPRGSKCIGEWGRLPDQNGTLRTACIPRGGGMCTGPPPSET